MNKSDKYSQMIKLENTGLGEKKQVSNQVMTQVVLSD